MLLEIAVQLQRLEALLAQRIRQLMTLVLGVAERDGAHRAEMVEQPRHRLEPLVAVDFIEALADAARGALLGQLHFLRVAQKTARQRGDAFGEGG